MKVSVSAYPLLLLTMACMACVSSSSPKRVTPTWKEATPELEANCGDPVILADVKTFERARMAENEWIEGHLPGARGRGSFGTSCGNSQRALEIVEIRLANGSRRSIAFDISSVFANACTELPPAPPGSPPVSPVEGGLFTIELTASSGSREGARAQLVLRLEDPPAAQKAAGRLLIGSLTGDLAGVGAPICKDGAKPASQSPGYRGVVLERWSDGRQVLVVGSVGNRWNPNVAVMDGCGIGMWIDKSSPNRFSGRWSAWGIVVDGCGYFEAKRIRK